MWQCIRNYHAPAKTPSFGTGSSYDGQAYLNAATAYNQLLLGHQAHPATGQLVAVADVEEGYDSWGPLGLWPRFCVTKAYSLVEVKNTSLGDARFEVLVLWGYAGSAYGVS